jgi:hypothetical protein
MVLVVWMVYRDKLLFLGQENSAHKPKAGGPDNLGCPTHRVLCDEWDSNHFDMEKGAS